MALLTKPNMQQVWASGGDIVEPSDLKKQQGWTVEVPPHQFENWIQNRQDEYLAHINQRGIPAWDGLTDYEAGGLSYVQGSDGKIYKSVVASGPTTSVQDPTTDVSDTCWTVAFADVGAFITESAGDARYLRQSLNGSDIPNTATFRTNIGVVDANDTVKGIQRNATQVEVDAGSLDTVTVTPAKMRFGSSFSDTTTGFYLVLPSWLGGFMVQIIKTGSIALSANQVFASTLTYPVSFPNKVYGVLASSSNQEVICSAASLGTAQVSAGFKNTLASPASSENTIIVWGK